MFDGQGVETVTASRASEGAPDHTRSAQPTGPTRTTVTRGRAHATARACTLAEDHRRPRRTDSGSRVPRTANNATPHTRWPGTVHASGSTERSTPPAAATVIRPPVNERPGAACAAGARHAAPSAIAAARARSAAARAAAPGPVASHESQPAARTPQAPVPYAPTEATTRTDRTDTERATTVSNAAVTSSADVIV
jgi:hypothetical protein